LKLSKNCFSKTQKLSFHPIRPFCGKSIEIHSLAFLLSFVVEFV